MGFVHIGGQQSPPSHLHSALLVSGLHHPLPIQDSAPNPHQVYGVDVIGVGPPVTASSGTKLSIIPTFSTYCTIYLPGQLYILLMSNLSSSVIQPPPQLLPKSDVEKSSGLCGIKDDIK